MKVSELTGAALDWAVAKCEGNLPKGYSFDRARHGYSCNWAQGGPIIEREKIGVWWAALVALNDGEELGGHWYAERGYLEGNHVRVGPTPLIAAMRCFVASCLGDEVNIPEELK